MTADTVGIIVSNVVAVASLSLVVYREFFSGPRLKAQLDRLGLLRINDGDRAVATAHVLIQELSSDSPSEGARAVLNSMPGLADATASRDTSQIAALLHERATKTGEKLSPPKAVISHLIENGAVGFPLYVPLLITNEGRRTAHVSSLMLTIAQGGERWLFHAVAEVELNSLLRRREDTRDEERVSRFFVGLAIAPQTTARIDAMFIPLMEHRGRQLNARSFVPGAAEATVRAFGADGRELLRTKSVKFEWAPERFLEAFLGNDMIDLVALEDQIDEVLESGGEILS